MMVITKSQRAPLSRLAAPEPRGIRAAHGITHSNATNRRAETCRSPQGYCYAAQFAAAVVELATLLRLPWSYQIPLGGGCHPRSDVVVVLTPAAYSAFEELLHWTNRAYKPRTDFRGAEATREFP
jgi:hypothetical protein